MAIVLDVFFPSPQIVKREVPPGLSYMCTIGIIASYKIEQWIKKFDQKL